MSQIDNVDGRRLVIDGCEGGSRTDAPPLGPVFGARPPVRSEGGELLALVAQMSDAIVVHRDGRIVYANPAWVSRLGYVSIDEVSGHALSDTLHPDDRAGECARRESVDPTDRGSPREVRYLRKDGEAVSLWLVTVRVTSAWGDPAVMEVARDMDGPPGFRGTWDGLACALANPLTYVLSNVEHIASEIPRLVEALAQREAQLLARFGARALDGILSPEEMLTSRLREIADALEDARIGTDRMRCVVRDLRHLSRSVACGGASNASEAVPATAPMTR